MFYHLILYIKIIYYLLSIIINNSNNINGNNTNKFQIQKPQQKRGKKNTQPTNKPEMKKRRPKLNQLTKLNQRLA